MDTLLLAWTLVSISRVAQWGLGQKGAPFDGRSCHAQLPSGQQLWAKAQEGTSGACKVALAIHVSLSFWALLSSSLDKHVLNAQPAAPGQVAQRVRRAGGSRCHGDESAAGTQNCRPGVSRGDARAASGPSACWAGWGCLAPRTPAGAPRSAGSLCTVLDVHAREASLSSLAAPMPGAQRAAGPGRPCRVSVQAPRGPVPQRSWNSVHASRLKHDAFLSTGLHSHSPPCELG